MSRLETISITTESKNGNLTRNRNLIIKAIRYFDGKVFDIVFKPKKKDSSDPQRKYYWGVIVPIVQIAIREQWGEIRTKDFVNEMLKLEFAFKEKVNQQTGQIIRIPISPTKEMTTIEREDYHSNCLQLAKDYFNVEIPLPNQDLEIEFNN